MPNRPLSSSVSTALVAGAALVLALACGGTATPEPTPAETIEFAQPAAPSQPAPVVEGLAGELGFPVGRGEVQGSDTRTFEILHRSAFDAGAQWADYRDALEVAGWTLRPTEVPPFEGVFVKESQQLQLSCELKGTSVFVRGTRIR